MEQIRFYCCTYYFVIFSFCDPIYCCTIVRFSYLYIQWKQKNKHFLLLQSSFIHLLISLSSANQLKNTEQAICSGSLLGIKLNCFRSQFSFDRCLAYQGNSLALIFVNNICYTARVVCVGLMKHYTLMIGKQTSNVTVILFQFHLVFPFYFIC